MGIFRKKSKKDDPPRDRQSHEPMQPKNLQEKSKYGQRSKIDESILRNGPDKGFVWYEEG
ncbi:MAG: hypothetical protein KKG33_08070 [candidate division Zixibacteria bacterium]|nr:hypothetical protein [candidate division Zixibacteria bacterium]MBU1469614.1 hypothetical protein [candidate division Zixibacteria bacterium]MBU2625503.1 hypothetical protein [candidate division Zixibacteria bacterium]